MKVQVYFSDSETKVSDFGMYLDALKKCFRGFMIVSPFTHLNVEVYKQGDCCETQKEKACNKGVRKQRRHKTVNACKPS